MMTIKDFEYKHIEEAEKIALRNYNEEKKSVECLPHIAAVPNLKCFADNGLGVVAFEQDKMIGFMCCYSPWNNVYHSYVKGICSPIHANGAIKENRNMIYKRMYQAAADKWVKQGIAYHTISLYAHNTEAVNALFSYGFGLRCIDAINGMRIEEHKKCDDTVYCEIPASEIIQIREMRKELSRHLSCSPCFIYSSEEDVSEWIRHAEKRNTRSFAAYKGDLPIAFIEIADDGENFATESENMKNICGAYCLPDYRGQNIVQGLLYNVICTLKSEGFNLLGVDFESLNPTAYGFWLKYFTAYTNSLVRRIEILP